MARHLPPLTAKGLMISTTYPATEAPKCRSCNHPVRLVIVAPSSRTERPRNANLCMCQMREHGHAHGALGVNRPFNCGLWSSSFLTFFQRSTRQRGSARPVGAGRGCGDGASADGMRSPARHQIGQLSPAESQRDRVDVCAGVMVLSEVAKRLMMMSGSGASTCPAECGRSAASRLNEVATTTVPAGHRRPSRLAENF
jgi:hypothetical protein